MSIETPNGEDKFHIQFSQCILHWNRAEGAIRMVVEELCGCGPKTKIFTANMDTHSLKNALLAAINEVAKPCIRIHLKYLFDLYDRLNPYRNFYVHNLTWIIEVDDQLFACCNTERLARGRLTANGDKVELEELNVLFVHLYELWITANVILNVLRDDEYKNNGRISDSFSSFQPPSLPPEFKRPS